MREIPPLALLAGIFAVIVSLYFSTPVFAVELIIHNDLHPGEEGQEMAIEEAISMEVPNSKIDFSVMPGEKKTITSGNVVSFIVVRKYSRHRIKYDIQCPKTVSKSGPKVINLLNIHQNLLPEGCEVIRTGHWSKRSGMNWESVEGRGRHGQSASSEPNFGISN